MLCRRQEPFSRNSTRNDPERTPKPERHIAALWWQAFATANRPPRARAGAAQGAGQISHADGSVQAADGQDDFEKPGIYRMKCPRCKSEFSPRKYNQVYCSKKCQMKARREKADRKRWPNGHSEVRSCRECGKAFVSKIWRRAQFCQGCRAARCHRV